SPATTGRPRSLAFSSPISTAGSAIRGAPPSSPKGPGRSSAAPRDNRPVEDRRLRPRGAGTDLEGRTAEQEALAVLDTEVDEGLSLCLDFDALGDQRGSDALADGAEAGDDLSLDR